jgi:hypothetical protein
MIVVVTVIALLAALAISAYNKIVNDAKIAKSKALMSTLATAKAMWIANPRTAVADVDTFNGGPDANFAMVAPYIRVNGAQPTDEGDLLTKSGMPSAGVAIKLGTVDDSSFGGQNQDQAPPVTGYGL